MSPVLAHGCIMPVCTMTDRHIEGEGEMPKDA